MTEKQWDDNTITTGDSVSAAEWVDMAQNYIVPSKTSVDTLSTIAMGVVVHGADAAVVRPTGYAQIIWIGSVDPTNKVTGDLWVDNA